MQFFAANIYNFFFAKIIFYILKLLLLQKIIRINKRIMDYQHKILVVDDEAPARQFVECLITSYIHNVKITKIECPLKALVCMENQDFDMLFLDIEMPGMTGLQLLERIRNIGKYPFTVIISAYRKFNYAVKGIELGVVKFITKPLYEDKIYEALNLYLQNLKTNFLQLKIPSGIKFVKINDILVIEKVERNKMNAYTINGIIPDITGNLNQLENYLPSHFHYIKRDCIVNCNVITSVNYKTGEVVIEYQNQKIIREGGIERVKQLLK